MVSKRTQPKTNVECLSEKMKEALSSMTEADRMRYMGYGNRKKIEPIPNFIKAECETVFEGENNTFITLGRDRPSSLSSGYGGSADSHAGAIDIVVGRAAKDAKSHECTDESKSEEIVQGLIETGKVPQPLLQCHNDFKSDAARIYISQKTNIDHNFGICPGKQGSARPRSAIGIKADLVRIIGRENIKLVTRTDDTNSQKGKIDVIGGIDLIAGNDDSDLQPLVKGNNLKELLGYMVDDIKRLGSLVHQISIANQTLETIVMNHIHAAPGAPSVEVQIGTAIKSIQDLIVTYPSEISLTINTILEDFGYLRRYSPKDILSKKNNTN
tara:strand:- start:497 stop:1477 length:981 start_codon:yes stop_codon:yes gene_type:complete